MQESPMEGLLREIAAARDARDKAEWQRDNAELSLEKMQVDAREQVRKIARLKHERSELHTLLWKIGELVEERNRWL